MSSFEKRRAGLVFGSFVAEALALGVHWIYDPVELAKRHGRVTGYHAPGSGSYHPKKHAGDQGHVGDQALRLMSFLGRERRWDAQAFAEDWRAMWLDYDDYFDHATKETLKNFEAGEAKGAGSNELAGPARIAPLIAFFADASVEVEAVAAAREQTRITHFSGEADEASNFLARASHRLLQGAGLEETIRGLAPSWALQAAEKAADRDAVSAVGELGRACPIPAALPAVIYLVLKHGDDFETACIENAMAGGDNCARGLALGMLLGGAHGVDAIPKAWRDDLQATPVIEAFLIG